MNRKADIYFDNELCGCLEETDVGYRFTYQDSWFNDPSKPSISLTLPKTKQIYETTILFPFFDGLIPEGYNLCAISEKWNIQTKDRMGILLKSGNDPIGAVTVIENPEENRP